MGHISSCICACSTNSNEIENQTSTSKTTTFTTTTAIITSEEKSITRLSLDDLFPQVQTGRASSSSFERKSSHPFNYSNETGTGTMRSAATRPSSFSLERKSKESSKESLKLSSKQSWNLSRSASSSSTQQEDEGFLVPNHQYSRSTSPTDVIVGLRPRIRYVGGCKRKGLHLSNKSMAQRRYSCPLMPFSQTRLHQSLTYASVSNSFSKHKYSM